MKKKRSTANIFSINQRFDVTLWRYLVSSVCPASTFISWGNHSIIVCVCVCVCVCQGAQNKWKDIDLPFCRKNSNSLLSGNTLKSRLMRIGLQYKTQATSVYLSSLCPILPHRQTLTLRLKADSHAYYIYIYIYRERERELYGSNRKPGIRE